jgi:hypothetical protein
MVLQDGEAVFNQNKMEISNKKKGEFYHDYRLIRANGMQTGMKI